MALDSPFLESSVSVRPILLNARLLVKKYGIWNKKYIITQNVRLGLTAESINVAIWIPCCV